MEQTSLAIETSSRRGGVALGRGGVLLGVEALSQPARHNVGLIPAIDRLTTRFGLGRGLDEVYVSIGPGSFTGLRTAVAAAKMLALAGGARLVAVPTAEAIAMNVSAAEHSHLAVCLNTKRGSVYASLFSSEAQRWRASREPMVTTAPELLASTPRPLTIVGEAVPQAQWPAGVRLLDAELAAPDAGAVWEVGRSMAAQGRFTAAADLLPCYARPPEAVELWNQRHGPGE